MIHYARDGASPSGKAAAFGAAIRRFESSRPSLGMLAGASSFGRETPVRDACSIGHFGLDAPPVRLARFAPSEFVLIFLFPTSEVETGVAPDRAPCPRVAWRAPSYACWR